MMSNKIENGCFAIARDTGEAGIVGQKLGNRMCGFTWELDCGCSRPSEYTARELRRVSPEDFAKFQEAQELAGFEQLCRDMT